MAEILDGEMAASGATITVLSGGENTKRLLIKLAESARDAGNQDKTFGEFIEVAEKIDPALGLLAKRLGQNWRNSKPSKKWWLTLAFALIAASNSCSVNISLNVNELAAQLLKETQSH
jgi:hypothetical protein